MIAALVAIWITPVPSNQTWHWTAVYQTSSGTQYELSGTGTGISPQCPPFANGGKDKLVSCKID